MAAQKGKLHAEDERKIQINYTYLLEEMDAKDLVDIMYTRGVFDLDSLDEIKHVSPYTRKHRTEKFIEKLLFSGQNGYKVFLESLNRSYPHITKKLEATDVQNDQTSRNWFDDIPHERKQRKISEKDLSRLVQSLGHGWEHLAYELNFNKAQIEQAKMGNSTPFMQILSILTKWRQREANAANYENLVKALNTVDNVCTIDWDSVQKVVEGET